MKANKNSGRNKLIIVILSLILILTFAAGTTLAWLATSTQGIENSFTPGNVSCEVEENFNNSVKENVKIRNTGSVDAYIRAAVVINLADSNNNISATNPESGIHYTITYGDNWQQLSDGYYYYKGIVESDGVTSNLIESCSGTNIPSGYHLKVQILADAIQAYGMTAGDVAAVTDAWGVSFSDDDWS